MFLRASSFLTFSTMLYILIAINATSEMFLAIFVLISACFHEWKNEYLYSLFRNKDKYFDLTMAIKRTRWTIKIKSYLLRVIIYPSTEVCVGFLCILVAWLYFLNLQSYLCSSCENTFRLFSCMDWRSRIKLRRFSIILSNVKIEKGGYTMKNCTARDWSNHGCFCKNNGNASSFSCKTHCAAYLL